MRNDAAGNPVINKAEEMDRLIAFYAATPAMRHRLPFMRAVKAQKLSMCEIERGGVPDWRELERLSDRRPVMLLIGDDDHQATGPRGFPGLNRLRLLEATEDRRSRVRRRRGRLTVSRGRCADAAADSADRDIHRAGRGVGGMGQGPPPAQRGHDIAWDAPRADAPRYPQCFRRGDWRAVRVSSERLAVAVRASAPSRNRA
jgi:hypothetical protein